MSFPVEEPNRERLIEIGARAVKGPGGECNDLTPTECHDIYGQGCLCWERAAAVIDALGIEGAGRVERDDGAGGMWIDAAGTHRSYSRPSTYHNLFRFRSLEIQQEAD